MPNPKTGTVTMDIEKAVKNVKAGQVEYRVDRQAAIHAAIGKVSFTDEQLIENFDALRDVILRARPSAAKGQLALGKLLFFSLQVFMIGLW